MSVTASTFGWWVANCGPGSGKEFGNGSGGGKFNVGGVAADVGVVAVQGVVDDGIGKVGGNGRSV